MLWCCCETAGPVYNVDVSIWFPQTFNSSKIGENDWRHVEPLLPPGDDYLMIGQAGVNPSNPYRDVNWLAITQGAGAVRQTTITSAFLDLYRSRSGNFSLAPGPHKIRVFVEDADNVGELGFGNYNTVFNAGQPPTTPNGSWLGPVTADLIIDGRIDITSQVQAVLNRPGFAVNSVLVVLVLVDVDTTTTDYTFPQPRYWRAGSSSGTVPPYPVVHNFIDITI